jgi:hypothetical protein
MKSLSNIIFQICSNKKFEGSLIVFYTYNLSIFGQNVLNYSKKCLKELKCSQKWKIIFYFLQKGDGLGGIISSQNNIERHLISSPPPPQKKDIQILKNQIFWHNSSLQDFRWIFHLNSCTVKCILVGVFWEIFWSLQN